MLNISRRKLLVPAMAIGGASLLPKCANADVAFTQFAFRATGAPSARTMPDRLTEIKNVLDFGADPSGSTDCHTAIQNAVNWTSGPNRGTIFFPPGFYTVKSPITFNYNGALSIRFLGEGAASFINGTGFPGGTGFVLDRSLGSPNNTAQVIIEKLSLSNDAVGATSGGIRVGSCSSVAIRDCRLGGNINLTTEDSPGNSSTGILLENVIFPGGSNGLIMGGSGAVLGCDWTSCAVAARMYGKGWYMAGNRIEECNTAYLLGVDSAGTNQGASGFVINGGSAEGNLVGMDLSGTCSAFYIGSIGFLGHSNSGTGQNLPTQRGIFVRANMASNGIFVGCHAVGDLFNTAALEVDAATSRANLLFLSCQFSKGAGTGVDVIAPSNAYTAQFQLCNFDTFVPAWTFSQLPTGGNVLEGDEFTITDPNTNTWGASVTASGSSGHVLVRWNGSNWTVVAK